ncbi:MAG: Organic hydroperoxide resistance transcriptional regulator, partial [uncultured Ramlibacter sp.]
AGRTAAPGFRHLDATAEAAGGCRAAGPHPCRRGRAAGALEAHRGRSQAARTCREGPRLHPRSQPMLHCRPDATHATDPGLARPSVAL